MAWGTGVEGRSITKACMLWRGKGIDKEEIARFNDKAEYERSVCPMESSV